MPELLPIEPGEEHLEPAAAELVGHIRASLAIHFELLTRVLQHDPRPNQLLAAMLETVGNRYIDFSDEVTQAVISAQRLNNVA